MSTYAIGDLQGCLTPLEKLLQQIQFDATKDTLWFTGDLVNRGSQSLETLRFVKQLGDRHRVVLGNHDLHLLAVAHGAHPGWPGDTLSDILKAPDRETLIDWLRHQPLLYHDAALGFTMAHAGIAPSWNLATAMALAKEVEAVLQSEQAATFFQHMYGNTPDLWQADLTGWDRLRCITNYFTRMRFCEADGRLELNYKGTMATHPAHLLPWFTVPHRQNLDLNIVFGHWAALSGVTNTAKTFALDTGCVWGFCLTAMCLEDGRCFQVSCQ